MARAPVALAGPVPAPEARQTLCVERSEHLGSSTSFLMCTVMGGLEVIATLITGKSSSSKPPGPWMQRAHGSFLGPRGQPFGPRDHPAVPEPSQALAAGPGRGRKTLSSVGSATQTQNPRVVAEARGAPLSTCHAFPQSDLSPMAMPWQLRVRPTEPEVFTHATCSRRV